MKSAPLRTVIVLLMALAGIPAQARLIFSESFEDFKEGWGEVNPKNNTTEHKLVPEGLKYDGDWSKGGHLSVKTKKKGDVFFFSRSIGENITEGQVWFSYLFYTEKMGAGNVMLTLHDRGTSTPGSTGNTGAGVQGGNLVAFGNHRPRTKLSLKGGKVYRIVVSYELKPGPDSLHLWVDPPMNKKPDPAKATTAINWVDLVSINEITTDIRFPTPGAYCIDELRISDTWSDLSNQPAGPTSAKMEVASQEVGGPFYTRVKFSNQVRGLSKRDFKVKNGRIAKLYGSGREYSLLIEPGKAGKVSVELAPKRLRGIAKNGTVAGGAKTSATYRKDGSLHSAARFETSYRDQKNLPYLAFRSAGLATSWYGKNLQLKVDFIKDPETWDQVAISKIVYDLDKFCAGFQEITGQEIPNDGRVLIHVADKPIAPPASNKLLMSKRKAKRKAEGKTTISKAAFMEMYEMAKKGTPLRYPSSVIEYIANQFEYIEINLRIGYRVSKSRRSDWWGAAFAKVSASVIAEEHGMEQPEDPTLWIKHFNTYKDNKVYNWFKSFNAMSPPWDSKATLDDLMAGLLLHLCNEHGGKEMLVNMHKELLELDILKNTLQRPAARDNFALAASRAAKKDLTEYFNETLKWPVSPKVAKALKK